MIQIQHFIALVDRTRDWGPLVEARLRRLANPSYPVIAFVDSRHLFDMISEHPLRMPLVVVADTDAVFPTPETGVFARLASILRRCLFVYYSANPTSETMQKLSRVAEYRLVNRASENSAWNLHSLIEGKIRDLEESSDWLLIQMYESYVSQSQQPEVSTVDDDSLSPLSMLREMARGSAEGKDCLRAMIPASWKRPSTKDTR